MSDGAAPARTRPGRPPRLSREAIVSAALTLVDREGAAALTMRRLAGELGVEAMSIYRHVAHREALLDALAERLSVEFEPRGRSDDWQDAVRWFAGGLRGLARAHPGAFELVGTRVVATTGSAGPVAELVAALRAGGFSPARAVGAYRIVLAFTRGYVLSEIAGFAVRPSAPGATGAGTLSRRLTTEPGEGSFRRGVETIVTGLSGMLAER